MASGALLSLPLADDLHLHVRDGDGMASVRTGCITGVVRVTRARWQVMPAVVARCRRAIIMPNLTPPVTTTAAAVAYRQRIMDSIKVPRRKRGRAVNFGAGSGRGL
jgi:dihydroorotase